MIDLCIPTYNEADIIADSLRIVEHGLQNISYEWQIVIADNGSVDGTADIVEALQLSRVRVLSIPKCGKGAAIVAVAQTSTAELFGFIDADLSVDPGDIGYFIRYVESGHADIVIGSRLIDTHLVQRALLRSLSSRLFNLIRCLILGIHVTDSQCGLKVMNARGREILAQCTEKGWFMDIEFLRRAELAGLTIREMPVHWVEYRFTGHKSKLRMISDGWEALRAMIRIRRSVSNNQL